MRKFLPTLRLLFTFLIVIIAITSFRVTFFTSTQRSRSVYKTKLFDTTVNTVTTVNKGSGYTHTDESKAKISAGNKGKTPWNQGIKHSEETRRRIAEKTREAALQKKLVMAAEMGMTIEEFDKHKKAQAIIKSQLKKGILIKAPNGTIIPSPNATLKVGLTEDGRKRISESIKARWQNEDYRQKYTLQKGRQVSPETRQRISQALKLKWQDQEYRSKCMSTGIPQEQRDKISNTLKNKWNNDPEFKARMKQNLSYERSSEWRLNVSQKIKDLWNDPSYRNKVVDGYKNATRTYTRNTKSKLYTIVFKNGTNIDYDTSDDDNDDFGPLRRTSSYKTPQIISENITHGSTFSFSDQVTPYRDTPVRSKQAIDKESNRAKVYAKAKQEIKESVTGRMRSIKTMLGDENWTAEKVKRSRKGHKLIEDNTLEIMLMNEWLRENDNDSINDSSSSYATQYSSSSGTFTDSYTRNYDRGNMLYGMSGGQNNGNVYDPFHSDGDSLISPSKSVSQSSSHSHSHSSSTTTKKSQKLTKAEKVEASYFNFDDDEEDDNNNDYDDDDDDGIEFVGVRGSNYNLSSSDVQLIQMFQ